MVEPLQLPDVTLVCIDNVAVDLAELAIRECTSKVQFGNMWICTPPGNSVRTYSQILQHDAPRDLRTSHALVIQYDSWVLDASLWQESWLQYDYIGAPWPWYGDDLKVGNGGFSLRSKRLMDFLARHANEFPFHHPEDGYICRMYRRALETHGFKWAPLEVARQFSFEREEPHPTFGFHGIFNWPHVLPEDGLVERMAYSTEYVRSKPEWRELGIVKALQP